MICRKCNCNLKFRNAHKDSGESQVSVTGLLWLDDNILASVSGNDGTVKEYFM